MKNWIWIVCGAAVAVLSATSIIVAFSPKDESKEIEIVSVKVAKNSKPEKVRIQAKSGGKTFRVVTTNDETSREKPVFALDEDDEANLTDAQRTLIAEIRKALDDENESELLKLIQQLQASKEWPDGIPKAIKIAAIEALGWFGPSTLPELVGFIADSDSDVVDSAIELWEEAISDIDLSDREKAAILLEAAKVVYDADVMDSMLFELNNMRHSVAVETIKTLLSSENPAVKETLQENIDLYTGEEEMNTPEKLDEWLAENPDDEDDDTFYGGEAASDAAESDEE